MNCTNRRFRVSQTYHTLRLGLSEHTVKNYLFRVFEKLGVSSRVELLFYFTTHGHSFESPRAEQDEANAED
jgi:hypothetical protein